VTVRVDRVVVAGIFSLDGEDYEVENNVWLVGDDERVVIIDAPHDAAPILAAVAGRRVDGIVCTHGHNDHINAAAALAEATGAPIALHPDDEMLWDVVHPTRRPDMALSDGQGPRRRRHPPARAAHARPLPRRRLPAPGRGRRRVLR
jgi:glyoxylase-like metal-dependent hydrolase (beta-lactamase superfamily II)